MENKFEYIATQTDDGFVVNLYNSINNTIEIKNEDIEQFANSLTDKLVMDRDIILTEKEEILFNLWQMLLIPENVIH
ncbi:MAG: hypothetical protein IID03_07005 [Candidatus Dadabacteria bacterium]|jgi:hypothetical protein|nr:hypothetical protein [Candidatus Dadabacteria bacterium]TDI96615.1 MAG: hypothetical protein E2O29_02595 [Deltaproteobacteria bacterium]